MLCRTFLPLAVVVFILLPAAAPAQEKPPAPKAEIIEPVAVERLKELDSKIAAAPDDPKLHFEKAQCLMKLGQHDDGYQLAGRGKQLLGERSQFLRSMPLESIELETVRIEVQYNLGQSERTPPEIGIARPLTFVVWARGDARKLIEKVDFEIGYSEGKPNTAALGQRQGRIHVNFGVLDPRSSYTDIRTKAIELIRQRVALHPVQPQSGKKYMNVTLPGETRFTPIILSATPEKTIFARVTQVDGRRDIQVLQGSGDQWEFVGPRGRAVTGVDGNFLADARQGPDGRIWVLARYTPPSNPERGWRAFLYCCQDGRWSVADPPDGHPACIVDDCGLAFLATGAPAHLQLDFDEQSKPPNGVVPCLLQWRNGRWKTHPAEATLQESGGVLVWSAKEAWVIGARWVEGKTAVHGYRMSHPRPADVAGPYQLLTLDGSHDLHLAHLSDHHCIALLFKESVEPNHAATYAQKSFRLWGTDKPYLGRIIDVTRPDKPAVEKMAVPPSNSLEHLRWSPKRELVATICDSSEVQALALRNGKWTLISKASQAASEGTIFDPRLEFRSDGVPIVTWEDFFPH